MLGIWVKVRIKPELRQRFLHAIEVDALGAERDEPGCLRFNVLQDSQDENVYYFYEVYSDKDSLRAPGGSDTLKTVGRGLQDDLAGRLEVTLRTPVTAAGIDF